MAVHLIQFKFRILEINLLLFLSTAFYLFYSFCQPTYMKKLSFNSRGGTYSYAGDTILICWFDVFPNGNTLFQLQPKSQSHGIYKLSYKDPQYFPIQSVITVDWESHSSAVHATPDEGLIMR